MKLRPSLRAALKMASALLAGSLSSQRSMSWPRTARSASTCGLKGS